MADEIDRIIQNVKKEDITEVNLHFTDFLGSTKSVTIPPERLEDALEKGVWFDGSSIEGFTRISESDMYLMPDPSTYKKVAWEKDENVGQLMCDVYTPEGKPFAGDPRTMLKNALNDASEMGFRFMVGPELEFFLFRNGEEEFVAGRTLRPHDSAGYFDHPSRDQAIKIRREIVDTVRKMGVDWEMSHHEVAPGQHEIDFQYGDALETADKVITLKSAIKLIAHQHGTYASFMPKPLFGINGSGMHVHQSLFDMEDNNVFYDANDGHKLSEVAKQFIAGQLAHIAEITAVTNPIVNSYKRLVPGFEAPVYICWAQQNRSALIRVPRYSPGREKGTRAELRSPDPSCNPYMAFAMMLWAGLDGIKKGMQLGEPQNDDIYSLTPEQREERGIGTLPGSLHDAVVRFRQGEMARNIGNETAEKYSQAKFREWADYRQQVTPWELKTYLPKV